MLATGGLSERRQRTRLLLAQPRPGAALPPLSSRIVSLDLEHAKLGPAAAEELFSAAWPRLEHLNLSEARLCGTQAEAGAVASLVAAELPRLQSLILVHCDLNITALMALSTASWPLQELSLNYVGDFGRAADAACAALGSSAVFRHLSTLNVSDMRLDLQATAALLQHPLPLLCKCHMYRPRHMVADTSVFSAAALVALRELHVGHLQVSPHAYSVLAAKPTLESLHITCGMYGLFRENFARLNACQWLHLKGLTVQFAIDGNYAAEHGLLDTAKFPSVTCLKIFWQYGYSDGGVTGALGDPFGQPLARPSAPPSIGREHKRTQRIHHIAAVHY